MSTRRPRTDADRAGQLVAERVFERLADLLPEDPASLSPGGRLQLEGQIRAACYSVAGALVDVLLAGELLRRGRLRVNGRPIRRRCA